MSNDDHQHYMQEDDIVMEMEDDDEEEEESDPEELDEDDDDEDDDVEDDDEEDDDDMHEADDSGSGHEMGGDGAAAPMAQPPAAAESDGSAPVAAEDSAATARRRMIQEVMRDTRLSEQEKRMRIQSIMSGGRTCVSAPPAPAIPQPEANPACVHYERNCNIVAPCCNRIYGCRICHDELSPCRQPMNRFMIQEIVCKNCNTRQRTSNQCVNCQTSFGEYHCGVCNLWMSMSKKPFHCEQCGFCRVGGVEAFRHCNECCMCISVSVFETHQCFKDKYKNNCPVCREDMFSSRQSPQDLPCGHAIHAHCFRKLAGFDYRCPICKKTVVSQASMAAAWEARARDIAEHPMPPDLQRIVDIMCNDCETKSHNRQWHFLGIQCPQCNSFNTVVEQVVSTGGNDAPPQPPGQAQPPPGGNGAQPPNHGNAATGPS